MNRKGIILAGGLNTRLFPITKVISKQLLPVYDKPLIYYPISTLMLTGIKEILIISDKNNLPIYKKLLGNGKNFGVKLFYKLQNKPRGIAEALIIGKNFLKKSPVALILGDNIFYGNNLLKILKKNSLKINKNTIFAYQVPNPKQFGVVEFNQKKGIKSIEEKPKDPKSNFVVTGLYFFDKNAVDYASKLNFSQRGELEITDLNNIYLSNKNLSIEILGRGFSWFDCGTPDLLYQAQSFVQLMQNRNMLQIGCLEEIAIGNKWISKNLLKKMIKEYPENQYKNYLKKMLY